MVFEQLSTLSLIPGSLLVLCPAILDLGIRQREHQVLLNKCHIGTVRQRTHDTVCLEEPEVLALAVELLAVLLAKRRNAQFIGVTAHVLCL